MAGRLRVCTKGSDGGGPAGHPCVACPALDSFGVLFLKPRFESLNSKASGFFRLRLVGLRVFGALGLVVVGLILVKAVRLGPRNMSPEPQRRRFPRRGKLEDLGHWDFKRAFGV